MKFAIVFVAVVFFHESFGRWHTLDEEQGTLLLPYADVRDVNCSGVSGSICSDDIADCEKFFICMNGASIEGKCPSPQTCNAGSCSTTPSPLCEYKGLAFKCNTEGMYPDPSSCKKYNYCTPPISDDKPAISATCPDGFAYNAATTLCDKLLPNKVCTENDRVVPRCTLPGQNAALKASASYYFICLPYSNEDPTLYPKIYKCLNNQKYVGNYVCK